VYAKSSIKVVTACSTAAIPGAAANPVIADKMYSAFVNFYKNYRVNLNLS
jgi:Tfp pilus tip-associated adhesin PilY1